MADANNQHFDLFSLLKISDLDIRRVARNNLSLLVGEYYKTITKFLNRVPMTLESLTKIVFFRAADYDFRGLADIKTYLDTIGHSKFLSILDDIIHAGKMGHTDFASECAKKVLSEFNEFSARLFDAKKKPGAEADSDVLNQDPSPLFDEYEQQLLKNVLQQLEQEDATRKLRVLAIDDAPLMLQTISSVLSSDFKVYRMTNPKMLEKFLAQITPELFLLDYKMPEISGFELVPIIRDYPEHRNTPIIFLTSMGTADYISAALALGACDYIVKPFQGNTLREKVAKHIVRKKLF